MERRELITFLGAAAAVWKRAEKRPTALLREAGYFLLALASFATVPGLYFWLDVPLVAAAFTYLIVLVLLSLVTNLWSLIVLSFIGVGCLSYFFAPPIYSFRVCDYLVRHQLPGNESSGRTRDAARRQSKIGSH